MLARGTSNEKSKPGMSKKLKKIVWHKRKGKFISPNSLKPHAALEKTDDEAGAAVCEEKDRRKLFFKNLAGQIKSAAKGKT